MSDDKSTDNATADDNQPVNEAPPAKTFTQEELNSVIESRLARERAKYADYDELKAKADGSKTEMERLSEKLQALETENATNRVKALRADVASTKSVPAALLTADNKEDLEAQADAILAFAQAQNQAQQKAAGAAKPQERLRSGADTTASSSLTRDEIRDKVLGRK